MAYRPLSIAIVGATGAVGREFTNILEESNIAVGKLSLLASSRSEGEEVEFRGGLLKILNLEKYSFEGVDVVLGATSSDVAKSYVPKATEKGAIVIDNSSAYRMDSDIPLIVPEVNRASIKNCKNRGIIANPNCCVAQLVVALNPIHQVAGLKRVVVSTYQSTSGTGQKGMEALSSEVLKLYKNGSSSVEEDYENDSSERAILSSNSPYPYQIAFNGIPQIGNFLQDGMTGEEEKVINETKKILSIPELGVSATCIRVPWFACHGISVNIEMKKSLSRDQAMEVLKNASGVVLEDDVEKNIYPMPFFHAGDDMVYVGRVRQDFSVEHGLNMWVVADNLRKGAALNAIQILESLVLDGIVV